MFRKIKNKWNNNLQGIYPITNMQPNINTLLDPVVNFGKAIVSTGYSNLDTVILLATGHGSKLPNPYTDGPFNIIWYDSSTYGDPSDDPNVEIVRCTVRDGDILTVTRGQEGTLASNKNTPTNVYNMILSATKKTITDIKTEYESGVSTHSALSTGVHGVGISTVESITGSQAKVDTHAASTTTHGAYAGSGGGPGGAAITINAQNIIVSGSILANGGNGGNGGSGNQAYSHPGYGGSGGGASGGGIKLIASSNVNINNATITANGGGGATTGGGGRIKIYYGTLNNTGTTIGAGTIYYETTTGSASFTSTPSDARIWIDNIDQGISTPNTISGLYTGSHTYKLVSGIYTATGSFTVTTGMTTNISTTIAVTAFSISSNTYTCTNSCDATITTTWKNNGNTDITFRPKITVDTVPIQYASDITIAAGGTSNPIAIVTSTLPLGVHTICPLPN